MSLKLLLQNGANRELKSKSGKTALDLIKSRSPDDSVRLKIIDLLQMCYKIRN